MRGFNRIMGLTALYFAGLLGTATVVLAAGSGYFPTTTGSSWSYTIQGLTLSGMSQVMLAGTETVQVMGDGSFTSAITFTNGNTTTSSNQYTLQGEAVLVTATLITIRTVDTIPMMPWTETTTDNSYSSPQLIYPSSNVTGTHESSTSTVTTTLTTTYGGVSMPPSTTTSDQVVDVVVGPVESVTVPAGTFQALRMDKTLQVTEDGTTNSIQVTEWYAPGVGLVKMSSPTMNRELTGYSIAAAPASWLLTVDLQRDGNGTVNSVPSGFICSREINGGHCTKSYTPGSTFDLTATPDGNSLFTGWGGDCTGDACHLVMDRDRSVTATFSYVKPARIAESNPLKEYTSLQVAYDQALTGDVIETRAFTFEESLTLNQVMGIAIRGGYALDYLARSGMTVIHGTLTVGKGVLSVDRVAVK